MPSRCVVVLLGRAVTLNAEWIDTSVVSRLIFATAATNVSLNSARNSRATRDLANPLRLCPRGPRTGRFALKFLSERAPMSAYPGPRLPFSAFSGGSI